jgi:hypothetical protein
LIRLPSDFSIFILRPPYSRGRDNRVPAVIDLTKSYSPAYSHPPSKTTASEPLTRCAVPMRSWHQPDPGTE